MLSIVLALVIVEAISTFVIYHLTNQRLEVIHDLVNSNLTRVQADLVVAQQRIVALEDHLVNMDK